MNKIEYSLEWLSEYIWINIVDPKLKPIYENGKYTGKERETISFKILYFLLLYPLNKLVFLNWLLTKRLVCHIKGCIVRGGHGGFNLPYEAYYYECQRCKAVGSNYDNGDTSKTYPIIEKVYYK